jgi:hypothetical protein
MILCPEDNLLIVHPREAILGDRRTTQVSRGVPKEMILAREELMVRPPVNATLNR